MSPSSGCLRSFSENSVFITPCEAWHRIFICNETLSSISGFSKGWVGQYILILWTAQYFLWDGFYGISIKYSSNIVAINNTSVNYILFLFNKINLVVFWRDTWGSAMCVRAGLQLKWGLQIFLWVWVEFRTGQKEILNKSGLNKMPKCLESIWKQIV